MPNGPIDHLNTDLERSARKADTLFVSAVSDITAHTSRDNGAGWEMEEINAVKRQRSAELEGASSVSSAVT